MGLCIWQINCSVFHCNEVWKLYCETTITHSLCSKHVGLSKSSQAGEGKGRLLEREEPTCFRLTLPLNGFFYLISPTFLNQQVQQVQKGNVQGEEGERGKKQKQPKLSNLFIRVFVFEHLNESCVCFSLFSICDCCLLCSLISGYFVMTALILFYILFSYR